MTHPETGAEVVFGALTTPLNHSFLVPKIDGAGRVAEDEARAWPLARLRGEIARVSADMQLAASELRFEEASKLRDRLRELEELELTR